MASPPGRRAASFCVARSQLSSESAKHPGHAGRSWLGGVAARPLRSAWLGPPPRSFAELLGRRACVCVCVCVCMFWRFCGREPAPVYIIERGSACACCACACGVCRAVVQYIILLHVFVRMRLRLPVPLYRRPNVARSQMRTRGALV